MEGLDVVLFVGNEHAWAIERFEQGHYTAHLAIFVLILQNMLGKHKYSAKSFIMYFPPSSYHYLHFKPIMFQHPILKYS